MKPAFKTVALIGKYMNTEIREPLLTMASFLRERQVDVFIEEKTVESLGIKGCTSVHLNDIGAYADLAVVLGGDGTMLTVGRSLADYSIPLVGINRGRFGFLTDISAESMLDAMDRILAGEFTLEQRILLVASIVRDGQVVSEGRAWNDVVIIKGELARLIELELIIDDKFVHRQRSDGLIISTPTGTTAYALSSGGPLLHPTLEAVTLVPICPHTLSNRPLVISSSSTVEITQVHAEDARVHFDGQLHTELINGDKVIVKRLGKTITLLHPSGHSHYEMLREKLNWG